MELENDSDFLYALLGYFKKILILPKGNDAGVNRLIEMITSFTKEHPTIALELVDLVLQYNNASDTHVRFRVCQVVSQMFDTLPETEVDDEFFNKMTDCLLERARDKDKLVRAVAMTALHRLQSEDRVVNEYIRCLDHDSYENVRCAAIKSIKCTDETFGAILRRSSDTSSTVRETIFKRLEKVSVKKLPCSMLVVALEKGLVDLDSSVQRACKTLLRRWLSRRGDSIPELIRYLRPKKHPELCEKVIHTLLDTLLEEKKFDRSKLWTCIELDKYVKYAELLKQQRLTGEQVEITEDAQKLRLDTAFYWRVCLDYFVGQQQDASNTQAAIFQIDPEKTFLYENTMDFLNLLPPYQTDQNNLDVARQLHLMLKYYDFADPTLLENAVSNIMHAFNYIFGEGAELVSEYMEGLEHCVYDEDELRDIVLKVMEMLREKASEYSPEIIERRLRELRTIFEKISEQYTDLKKKSLHMRDHLRSQNIDPSNSNEFNELVQKYLEVRSQRDTLKRQISECKGRMSMGHKHEDYIHLMERVGALLSCYLKNPQHRDQIEHLRSILDNVVIPQINDSKRSNFIKILSQFAALDVTVAREYLGMYMQKLGEEEDVDACVEWIKGMSDIVMSHGIQKLEQGNETLMPIEPKIMDFIMWFASPMCSEVRLRELGAQALLQLCLKDRLSVQGRNMVLTHFASVVHFQNIRQVFFQQLVRSFFKAYSSRENYMENLVMVVIPLLRRGGTFTKDTIDEATDLKTYHRSLCEYIFRLINPEQLAKQPPSKEFADKFLYSRLLLLVIFEMEILGAKSQFTAILMKFLHPLLEFAHFENSKERHLYDYLYHAVRTLERHQTMTRKLDQKYLDSFKNELIELMDAYDVGNKGDEEGGNDDAANEESGSDGEGEEMRDEDDNQPAPNSRSGTGGGRGRGTGRGANSVARNSSAADQRFKLTGANLNHFKDLREQVMSSGYTFFEEIEGNLVPLQSHGLVFSVRSTSGTVGRNEAATISLPLYSVERISDSTLPSNTTTMSQEEEVDDEEMHDDEREVKGEKMDEEF